MPDVVVVDLSNVTIDGVSAGSIGSVLANHKDVHLELESALIAWKAELDATHKAALADQAATHAEAIAALEVHHTEAIAAIKAGHESEKQLLASNAEDATTNLCSKHTEELGVITARHATLCGTLRANINGLHAQITALNEQLADKDSLIKTLGGTEIGRRMACQNALHEACCRKKELETQIASLNAELKEMGESS